MSAQKKRMFSEKQIIRIFNGREIRTENAKQLSWVTEFSIWTEQPLQILFLAYSSLDNCI